MTCSQRESSVVVTVRCPCSNATNTDILLPLKKSFEIELGIVVVYATTSVRVRATSFETGFEVTKGRR